MGARGASEFLGQGRCPYLQLIGRRVETWRPPMSVVMRTGDRQPSDQIHTRGIPLPSLILLRAGGSAPHDVVDGKQRLTAILWVPLANTPSQLPRSCRCRRETPHGQPQGPLDKQLPKFRKAWKQFMGEPLTAKLEDNFVLLDFRLRTDAKGGIRRFLRTGALRSKCSHRSRATRSMSPTGGDS